MCEERTTNKSMGKKLKNNPEFSGAAAAQRTVFETVSLSSDSLFQRAVSILHTSYLDSASEHGFQYSQVTLVKNHIFLNEYKTFYQEKKASNYTQEELQETYGFLLFETEIQAKLVCQRGLCIGSSAISTLGDPAKGVYVSKYADYLHARPWYHGKSGYIVIFNLIKGKVRFVSENYTANYISPSSGYDCHVAANTNKVSHKTSHFRAFELSQYYLYELSGSTVIERPRQIHPYVIVAFQYREPKKMAAPAHKSILELHENVLISPWKGKLIIQGCLLCDITLWSSYGTVVPTQLPHELDFKYVMRVSSLKKILPEAAFRKQNYLEQKVCCQDMCFNMYEVELSNKQGEKIDKLTEVIKNKQLALIKCLEDREVFILLTSSTLISETNFGDEQMALHGLHLFHSSLSAGPKDLKVEDDIPLKMVPILPALNCALLEAKKSFTEEGICLNTLVKHNFQELYKMERSPLTTSSQDRMKVTTFFGKLSSGFDLVPPAEKCPLQSLTQLKSYFSDPSAYILEVSTVLDLLGERPQSPCISDGICDAGFSLVMTPDPEFLDSETEVRRETETKKNSEEMFKARKRTMVPLNPASNLRVQPKRKASMPHVVQSKRVNLCRPFPKRTPAGANKGSTPPATLKLVKGQFPQKRKRGAEVLTAQFVQTTKLDRKNQEAPISKDVQVATNAKRARKQEKSPVKSVPRAKPPVKKSPQKQRVNIVKGNQNSRIRKQPQPGETALQLQSKISSCGQEDVISINTVQPENITVAQKVPAENSIVNCDSQALNLLADLALSAATSTTPSSEPRNLPCSSELPQNGVLLSKEHSLSNTPDHEYHRGVKNQKGGLLPKPFSDKKSNLMSDSTVSQEEESLVPDSQTPAEAQSTLPEETREISDVSQSSSVAVEHSYALLLAEHSKKLLQQRGVPGPAFAKSGTKGPEAGTPVGKVMPFRHQLSTSPLQKLSEDPVLKRRSRFLSSSLRDFYCSHTVFSCDGSFKVTFKCETNYVFSLDSKYTNNPLEKTVLRALHGPWNTDLPDNMEEVKLLLHMWVALFYSNQNRVIRSSRKVVEHSNPAKYVSINSTIESFEFSEIEESPSVERCSVGPLLETKEAPRGHSAEVSFPDTNSLLPFIKPSPSKGLELWVQNEQKEVFARESHPDTSENQNFIYCNNEIIEGKAEQESSDKPEISNLVLSSTGSTQTNGSSIPGEDKTFEPLDSTRVTSYDTVTKTTFTKTCDGINSQSMICQKSVYSTLESKVDHFHATMQAKTSGLQTLMQRSTSQNKECRPSLGKKDGVGYVMINLEPVTLTFEKNACIPIQTEIVNRADKPTTFNMELIKQVSPATSLRLPVSTFEKVQTQGLKDILSLAASGEKDTKYLHAASVSGETLANNKMCSLQKEIPVPGSLSPSNNSLEKEVLPLVKSSNSSLPKEEMKHSREFFLQPKSLLSLSSEEILEPSQIEEALSASATLEKNYSLNCIPSRSITSNGSLELKNDKNGLNSENRNFGSFNSAFAKQTSLSVNGEEVSLELEEDSDIDLTLRLSPPTSPREEISVGETEQHQDAPLSNLELQDIDEDIIEPQEVTFIENREVNSAKYTSVPPTVSEIPLEKERKGDNLQMVTLILPKETCALELAEEVNATSDFPFGSLIEEVSPASSPDPQVSFEETQPSQAVSPCSLKHPDTQCEKSDKFSQIESVDCAITEKQNSFVGSIHPMGQDNLIQVQQIQLSDEMPLVLNNHPGRKDRNLTLLGKVTEEIVPNEHDKGFSFSEKVPCCDTELNQPASTASYRADFKTSVEKLVTLENPLQPISVEDRNSDLSHLALETREPPFSPRKNMENKSLVDTFVSTSGPGDIGNASSQQTSPKSIKSLLSSDLKTNEGNYMQAQSLISDSIGGADSTQAYVHSEIPNLAFSSSGATLTHFTRPINVETAFQTQEISVVRMASLLKNSETEAELHEKNIDLGGVGSESNTTSPKGKQRTIHMLQDTSTCKTKGLLNGGLFPMYLYADSHRNTAVTDETINKEPSDFFVPKSSSPLVCEVSKEQVENKSSGEGLRTEEDSETLGGDMDISVNSDFHYEPLSGDSDQDSSSDYRNLKLDMESSCTLRCSHKKKGALKDGFDSYLSRNNSDDDGWGSSSCVPGLETSISPRNWSIGLKKEDKCVPCYIQIRDLHGIPRTYTNFTITKELKDTKRTLHGLRRHPSFTAKHGLLSSWTNTWEVADNLTQNTLDLEYLRFEQKLKQIVKRGDSQLSATSTNVFLEVPPLQIAAEALPLPKISKSPVLRSPSPSKSTLMVTIMHLDSRPQSQHLRRHKPSNLSSSSFWKERCDDRRNHLTNSERNQTVSFHLNKLKYNSTSKESRNDISLILNEYAEFNKVMMNGSQVVFRDKESDVASGEATSREIYSSSPRRSASYEDMITDLCSSLRIKLKSVVKEACKSTFLFYLAETEDKSFFVRTKNILRKGGHTEIEPQHFCQAFHRENDTLMVIIRNEDISSHLHQLKHFPSVIFAGVDSPEDVLNYTFQELFQTGGFVVSDDRILETLTLVQLKEIVKILEKLNGNGRWKWLLHYRENKKLKEDLRVDSIAHKKNLILKSYQSANIIELLHYHQCDSWSSTKAEHLKCLLNLQIQHIHARFAVFLTEKTVSREVFENSGILVTDVNNFIENIQKVAAPFRSSYW
ncbi:PREDICTED: protein FAM208B isoform X2 [Miniopterus natalensis]|uniref:protein FAM208B isoform X2 n=1 Tax=Miniopterus natalensis TaxID=291302 RepID=UPI0007A6DBCB|nr:PREDICTED: protein FAM208B isoform X2 [Miniopterus natalensis]